MFYFYHQEALNLPDSVGEFEEYGREREADGEEEERCSHSTPEGVHSEVPAFSFQIRTSNDNLRGYLSIV